MLYANQQTDFWVNQYIRRFSPRKDLQWQTPPSINFRRKKSNLTYFHSKCLLKSLRQEKNERKKKTRPDTRAKTVRQALILFSSTSSMSPIWSSVSPILSSISPISSSMSPFGALWTPFGALWALFEAVLVPLEALWALCETLLGLCWSQWM